MVHLVTHEKLIMKIVRNEDPAQTKLQAQAELLALQMTYKCGKTIDLVDHFMDGEGNSYIITKKPKMTLTRYLDGLPSSLGVTVKFVAELTHTLSKALIKLLSKRIIHRNICMANIILKKGYSQPGKNSSKKK